MKILPDSVIGNIQEFDSCVTGSIPVPVAMLSLAYLVKRHIVNVKNRVRFPETTWMVYRSMEGYYATNVKMKVRLFLKRQWLVAQLAEFPAFNRKDVGSNPTGPTKQCVDMAICQ